MGRSFLKREWEKDEEERLRKAVQFLGEHNWDNVAPLVGARTPQQCLHRWNKVTKPGLRKGPWTPDEDLALRSSRAHAHRHTRARACVCTRACTQVRARVHRMRVT